MKRLSIILFFLLFALNSLISQNQQLALDISSLNELMLFRGKIETIKFNKRKKLVTLTLLVEETILGNNHQNGKTITIILNPIYATLIKDNPFVTYENISSLFMGILNRIPKDSVLVYCFNTTKYNYFIPVIEYLFLSFKLPREEFQAFAKKYPFYFYPFNSNVKTQTIIEYNDEILKDMKKMIELWDIYQQQGIEIWLDKFNKEYGQYTDNQLRYSSLLIFNRPDMPGRTISYYNNLYITNFMTVYSMANREEKNKIEEEFSSHEEFKTIIQEAIAEEQYLQILF